MLEYLSSILSEEWRRSYRDFAKRLFLCNGAVSCSIIASSS